MSSNVSLLEEYLERGGIHLDFWVMGVPAPQGSKRFLGVHGGKGIVVESSKRVAPWRSAIAEVAVKAMDGRPPTNGPLLISLGFWLPRPKSHYGAKGLRASAPKRPAVKPDLDKLARAALDAMSGIVWKDDAQVAKIDANKDYTEGTPGLHVYIFEPMP